MLQGVMRDKTSLLPVEQRFLKLKTPIQFKLITTKRKVKHVAQILSSIDHKSM